MQFVIVSDSGIVAWCSTFKDYYTPHDLVEKVINCRWLASRLRSADK